MKTLLVLEIVAATVALGCGAAQAGGDSADNGRAAYAADCATCHGGSLGGGMGPPLRGADFLKGWEHKTARNLYSRILTTMPATAPGSLSPATVVDLTKYLLRENGVDMGASPPKSPDDLNAITIKQ